MSTKTLEIIEGDMSELYEQLKGGQIETKTAAELANIAGKFLKANQLRLAWLHFERTDARFQQMLEERTLEIQANA